MADVKKFLDSAGTSYLWGKIKAGLDTKASNQDLDEAKSRITTLEGKVNTLETSGYDDTEVKAGISANAASIVDIEAALEEHAGDIAENAAAIGVLNGGSSVEGSVAYQIAQLVAGADASYDTLKEIADWIVNDTAGVGALNTRITTNAESITALQTLVGSSSVASQIAAAIEAEDLDKYALAADLTALASRVTTIEAIEHHSHSNQSVLDTITSAKVSAWDSAQANAEAYAAGLASNYATAAQGAKADSALQPADIIALTTAEIDTAIANASV